MTFVLVDKFASEQQGQSVWFKRMVGSGPVGTVNRDEAMEFSSRGDVACSPAALRALTFYEVVEEG